MIKVYHGTASSVVALRCIIVVLSSLLVVLEERAPPVRNDTRTYYLIHLCYHTSQKRRQTCMRESATTTEPSRYCPSYCVGLFDGHVFAYTTLFSRALMAALFAVHTHDSPPCPKLQTFLNYSVPSVVSTIYVCYHILRNTVYIQVSSSLLFCM